MIMRCRRPPSWSVAITLSAAVCLLQVQLIQYVGGFQWACAGGGTCFGLICPSAAASVGSGSRSSSVALFRNQGRRAIATKHGYHGKDNVFSRPAGRPTQQAQQIYMRLSDSEDQDTTIWETNTSVFGSAKVSRQQFLLGSWFAALGSAAVGGAQAQQAYQTRKRELFVKSIAGEDEANIRDVLEVGIGGNPTLGGFGNMQYYRSGQRIVGVDPALSGGDSQALQDAVKRAEERGVSLRAIEGVAEKLPFESSSFDAVVSTLVFCSVRDPAAALREVINMSMYVWDYTVKMFPI